MSRNKSALRLYIEGISAGTSVKRADLKHCFPDVKKARLDRMLWVMVQNGWLARSTRGCVIRTGKVSST